MARARRDVSAFAPWVDWNKAIAKVRGAKTDEAAIDGLKRDFELAFRLREGAQQAEIEQRIRRERTASLARDRLEAMAEAMANASEDPGDTMSARLSHARVLDAALQARRRFEI